ncbi:MAG: cell surface protein SprA [Ignavibacteriales bacterium]|nr:cell surface protein SprA [Ignavibacteriales bacterium]
MKALHESIKVAVFIVCVTYGLLSVGFTSQPSQVDDSTFFNIYFAYLNSYSDSNPIKILSEQNSNEISELLQASEKGSNVNPIPQDNSVDLLNGKFNQSLGKPDSLETPRKRDADTLSPADTSIKLSDSLIAKSKIDTTLKPKTLFLDSTARMEQFRYHRKDNVYTDFTPPKRSKFFAYPSSSQSTRTVTLDSTGNFVEIKEKIAGQETKVLLRIPLDEYINLRLKANNRNIWEDIAYKYELKAANKDLSQLLTDITNIDIPLPSVGFLSIFGPPVINLRIGGAVDIHGAWRSEKTEGVTASLLGNTRNEPDFKQQVQINVNGTIGDKLTIGADWNTERTFEYENQLKLKYKGYADEIVQSVEAGNVSLQTSPLVGGGEALFGIKAQFQMGPLNLTALASQKKGEVKEVSISGGSTSQDFQIHAYQYSKNHYFLDYSYADTSLGKDYFRRYYANATPEIVPEVRVKDIEVWKTKTGQRDNGTERQANAYLNLPSVTKTNLVYDEKYRKDSTAAGLIENGRFVKLSQGIDYELHPETGYITLKTQVQENDVIAVAYRTEGPNTNSNEDDLFYGELVGNEIAADTTKKLVLKLVKPSNLQPQYAEAWALQLKNIYPIGGRSVNQEGFVLDIVYNEPTGDPVNQKNGKPLLNAFGLDLVSDGNVAGPDSKFDFLPNRTIFVETGEIIFPVLQPFGAQFPKNLTDSLRYDAVYSMTTTFAQREGTKDRFLITGKYSAASSSTFNLGFTGIVENSVKVRLGGLDLKEGTDFVVDYNVGQVTVKNPAALVPGADLKISYEQNDLFQLASKTLIGLRGEFNFSQKTILGFSALNLNQQTLSDKVRIGEEPLNNSIYGLDFKTAVDLPFITKGISYLIPTRTMSSFSVQGEFAYINPDPNTKKSTISGDLGKSIAYIDDFEGTKKTIPIGLSYTAWHEPSVPNSLPFIKDSAKSVQMFYKGKSWWYTRIPSDVSVQSIWGKRKQVAKGDELVTVLDYVFDPKQKGTYNYKPRLEDPQKSWGGIMKILSSTANNLVEENIEFIEFWLNLSASSLNKPLHGAPSTAKLYLDLGKISEDAIPNGKLDTEDKNENDLIDNGEDTGLDGLFDPQENEKYNTTEADPSGDNYSLALSGDNTDYSHINGTEGNAISIDAGRFPDTEDLNRNLTLDQLDSYFRYEIPLDTSKVTNPYITGGGGGTNANWFQFRIPLKDFKTKIGDPSFSIIEYIRLWVDGVSEPVHIRLAEFNLAGNQWQKVVPQNIPEDSVLTLSVANYEDNYPTYYLPPGVAQERDRSKPDEQVFRNEQSLSLILNDLKDGDERQVVKYLRPMDLFNYKEMKLFIHGDERGGYNISDYVNKDSLAAETYFRFGSDTSNYYEYRLPVQKGWQDLSIKFDELTTLKQLRDTSKNKEPQLEVPGMPGHYYRIKGSPALTKISFFMAGVLNPKGKGIIGPISGDVWVNELRVIGADDQSGWAYSASAKFNIGDIATVNFNTSQTNPNFHKLSDRFGNRLDSRSWGVNVDLDILKLLPFNLPGSNLKINYARTEQLSKPIYQPGTDVKVAKAAEQLTRNGVSADSVASFIESTRSINTSETWTLAGIKLKIPSQFWLAKDFFNNLQWGFNYNKTFGRSPTIIMSNSWQWSANMGYQLNLSQNNFFYPANIPVFGTVVEIFSDYRNVKFYFTPQSFTWNMTASRNYNFSLQRGINTKPAYARDFKSTRNFSLQWKLSEGGFFNLGINYSFDFSSSLAHLLTITDPNSPEIQIGRPEGQIWKDIFSKEFFGRDFQFQQNFDLRSTPKLPSLWDINKFFTLTWGYGASYSWQNNFQQLELGRAAGFNNKVNASIQLKLKSLVAPLFKEEEKKVAPPVKQPTTRTREKTPTGENRVRQERGQRQPDQGLKQDVNINADSLGKLKDKIIPDSLNKINGGVIADSIAKIKTGVKTDSLAKIKSGIKPDSLAKVNTKIIDSLAVTKTPIDSSELVPSESPIKIGLQAFKSAIRYLFFDYETIQINFSNDNSVQKSGIQGTGSGIANFFGYNQKNRNGPSRAFMLGFSNDVGARAPNGNLSDNLSQRNNIDFRTSRPLWEGANIELKWKVNWQVSKATTIKTDTFGVASISSINSTGSISRSFVSFPPILFFKSGIKKVNELYNPESDNLSDAFVSGFETFPIVSKLPFLKEFMKYIPRPNWSFTWDGLEKYTVFKSWAKKVSLTHAYSSDYSEGWKIDPDGRQVVQTQKVSYGFAPLIGLNLTFNSLWNGNLTGNIKYGTKTGYDLGASTRNITESFSKDIGISASYSKTGFEVPLFGVSLKNDIEISFSYTTSTNSVVVYNMSQFTEAGTPQDGTLRTTIEPRIKYVISAKVTLSVFYKNSSVKPQGAARITPSSTNEAGLDVHISIQ